MNNNSFHATGDQVGWQKRHTVVLVCFFVMFISYIDRVNISVAVLAMQEEFGWSESRKGLILSSFFFGYMLMQIVGGWLANLFGGKRVLIISLILTSLCTALTPVAAYFWLPVLIMVRVALGISEAPINPAVYNIFGRIVPKSERSRSIALYSSAGFLGTFVALALTGWIVETYGWKMPFYSMGVIGIIYAIFLSRFIGQVPIDEVLLSDGDPNNAGSKNIPWIKLITQPPFWALVFSFFTTSWVFYVLLSWMPSYFSAEHGLDVANSGFYSMAPWIIMFVMMNISGWISDSLVKHKWSTTRTRKIFTFTGLFGAGVMLIFIRHVATPEEAMLIFCLALGFLALSYASQAPNVLDIAPRYGDILFGILNTFGSLPGIIGVALTGILVQSTGSYDQALGVSGVMAIIGGIVFLLFGTGKKLIH